VNTRPDLATLVAHGIRDAPGQTAQEIAAKLSVDKREVNSLLYGRLRGQFRQDKRYRWHPAESPSDEPSAAAPEATANTPLARLCRYYLACLGQDAQDRLSVFASGQHGLDYVPLTSLVEGDEVDTLFENEAVRNLVNKMRRDRSRLALYLGYPIYLRKVRSRRGWEGLFVEPIVLRSFDFNARDFNSRPRLSDDYPSINLTALRGMNLNMSGDIMNEVVQLESELGLDLPPEEVPELYEIVARLCDIRPEWDWREQIQPQNLNDEPHPSKITVPGIYNRAVLFVAERSPYTQGLELELQKLATLEPSQYSATVLGAWVEGHAPRSSIDNQDDELLEVLPMNVEQREAVQHALTQPMTAITGPPGTG